MVAAGSDIALLVTADGMVKHVYLGADTPPANDARSWSGERISDIVTEESREKIVDMLAGARSAEAPRWREINHLTADNDDFPVRYAAVPSGSEGDVILLGRDLRMAAQLQKRLVEAQLTMEQDYERIRQIETRYRVLFETTKEALLIVSSESGRIVDANSAAARLLGREARDLTNKLFADRFDPSSHADLTVALAMVRESGRERTLSLVGRDKVRLAVDVLLFRSISETLYLCRLTPRDSEDRPDPEFDRTLTALYGRTGDAMVFTDAQGRIERANTAFLAMADVAVGESLRGVSFGEFLGRPELDLNVLMTNARAKGQLSVYATAFRSAFGVTLPVEISTTWLPDGDAESYGFILRDVSRSSGGRATGGPTVTSESVERIIDLVGTTPLKDLVRGTTDVVEKLCIETAIKLTNNNRASAAEMLGLSRQSLYVKLRKYGLISQDE